MFEPRLRNDDDDDYDPYWYPEDFPHGDTLFAYCGSGTLTAVAQVCYNRTEENSNQGNVGNSFGGEPGLT